MAVKFTIASVVASTLFFFVASDEVRAMRMALLAAAAALITIALGYVEIGIWCIAVFWCLVIRSKI